MTTTDQILAMMRDEATKNFNEGKTTAEWTEASEAKFRFYMDFYSEEVRLKILADKEGQEKFGWFGLVMMKCYFPLGGKKEEEPENSDNGSDDTEVYGVCEECGKEGKFIGKEGDDWTCERCSMLWDLDDEESDEQDTDGSDEDLNGAISVSGSAF